MAVISARFPHQKTISSTSATNLPTISKRKRKRSCRQLSSTNISTIFDAITNTPSPSSLSKEEESPMTVSIEQSMPFKHSLVNVTRRTKELTLTEQMIRNNMVTVTYDKEEGMKINNRNKNFIGIDLLSEEEFVSGLVIYLERIMNENRHLDEYLPNRENEISVFYSTMKQPFGLTYYIERVVKHMQCSRSVFILALCYLNKLYKKDNYLGVCELNIHRLFIIACSTAAKWLEDECFCNEYYQRVGGVPTIKEFNRLESVFLNKMDWRLDVGRMEFDLVKDHVINCLDFLSDVDSD